MVLVIRFRFLCSFVSVAVIKSSYGNSVGEGGFIEVILAQNSRLQTSCEEIPVASELPSHIRVIARIEWNASDPLNAYTHQDHQPGEAYYLLSSCDLPHQLRQLRQSRQPLKDMPTRQSNLSNLIFLNNQISLPRSV